MTEKELFAGAKTFVEETFKRVDGHTPSKKAVNGAAQKIAKALNSTMKVATTRQPA